MPSPQHIIYRPPHPTKCPSCLASSSHIRRVCVKHQLYTLKKKKKGI